MTGKLVRVGEHRAIEECEGDLPIVIADRFMIRIEVSASAEEKSAFAKAINFKAFQSIR